MAVIPKTIKLYAESDTVAIVWSDGHQGSYPYSYLRNRCPCATCTGSEPASEPPPGEFPMLGSKPLRPDRAELVGRYALQIFWNDGHSSGIYAFDYLRGICPCPACAAALDQQV